MKDEESNIHTPEETLRRLTGSTAMKEEILIEQIAEIRALQVASVFMLTMVLEMQGVPSHGLLTAIDLVMTKSADRFESSMREAAGLDPRSTPREPMLSSIDEDFRAIDWSKLTPN